jgi:hypothetical protein
MTTMRPRTSEPSVGIPATGPATMVREYCLAPVHAAASVARMVKVKSPGCSGTPLMDPVAGLSVSPVGNAPLLTAYVYGAVPPVATTDREYGVAVTPAGSMVGFRVMTGQPGAAIVIVQGRLPRQPLASAAVMVNRRSRPSSAFR